MKGDVMGSIGLGVLYISIAVALILMIFNAWKFQSFNSKDKLYYMLMLTCITLWLFSNSLRSFSSSEAGVLFWHEAKFLGVAPMPSLILLFALSYTKRSNKWIDKLPSFLALYTGGVLFLIATNTYHYLFRKSLDVVHLDSMMIVKNVNGPLFWFHTGFTYTLILVSMILFFIHFRRMPSYYKGQPLILILALLPPLVVNFNFVFSFFDESYDLTAIGFIISAVVFQWAIFKYRAPEIIPIARSLIVENMNHVLIVVDLNGLIVDYNKTAQRVLEGFDFAVEGRRFETAFEAFTQKFNGELITEGQLTEFRMNLEGRTRYYAYEQSPILDKNRQIGTLVMFNDMTEQREMMTKLENMAKIDSLTGLYSRVYFESIIDSINDVSNGQMNVLYGGINGFKIINETFGTNIGDQLLKELASVIKEACGQGAVVVRSGGDEFMAIVSCSEKELVTIVENINDGCEKISHKGASLSFCQSYSMRRGEPIHLRELIAKASKRMYRKKLNESQSSRSSLISSLKTALEQSDLETKAHADRTQELALKIGNQIGLNDSTLNDLSMLSVLHDIGKIAIPDSILLKPGRLTDEEFDIMKTHTEKGYVIALASPELVSIADGILHHHEKWDGTGYPAKLAGEDISIEARIICLVDAFDVMTNSRPYKKAMPIEDAIAEVKRCSGSQFDPKLVDVLVELIEREVAR